MVFVKFLLKHHSKLKKLDSGTINFLISKLTHRVIHAARASPTGLAPVPVLGWAQSRQGWAW